ncbi:MAG TPA: FAD-binding oxidoreductase [Solirubrobacteraceae bacterium]|nr:FAD-binding oxidoreductase [Solirubrobacteraceae bacterium]
MASEPGQPLRRGEHGYEQARRASMWNARTPERYPEAIARPRDPDDVIAAVALARAEGLAVTICSGGHSWAGNHLRDGGLLIDLSRLDAAHVDPERARAVVGPGCRGTVLLAELARHGLFFPVGHCVGVAVGGYLLQGGYGWNGRVLGPACMSVEAIDVVTADGQALRADGEHQAELLWAARGSGPGFFAAVTGFHLRLHPRPGVVANSLHTFPVEVLEDLFRWVAQIGREVPRSIELMLLVHRDETGELEIAMTAPVLADDEERARADLSVIDACPLLGDAKLSVPYVPVSFEDLFAGSAAIYPDAHRWAVDNMWTHAPVEELLPGLRRIADTLPEAPSHMLWMNWGPSPPRPEMAYSVEDDTYIALYGAGTEAATDAIVSTWATERMREMEPLASGIQLADENLGRRPARFVSDEHLRRLDELRTQYDPDGLFCPWMGRPPTGPA